MALPSLSLGLVLCSCSTLPYSMLSAALVFFFSCVIPLTQSPKFQDIFHCCGSDHQCRKP